MIRLDILQQKNLKDRFKRLAIRGAFGFFPDGMAIGFVKTDFDMAAYTGNIQEFLRMSPAWSKGEAELFASYVSAQNDCHF